MIVQYTRDDSLEDAAAKGRKVGAEDAARDLAPRSPPAFYSVKQRDAWRWAYEGARFDAQHEKEKGNVG